MPKGFSKKPTTLFQKRVYKVVKQIPKGEISTYSVIAQTIGYPRAWRAVGNVLNKNKDSKIPCHRVIRSDGKIGGYNRGVRRKIFLLKKEMDFAKLKMQKEKLKTTDPATAGEEICFQK